MNIEINIKDDIIRFNDKSNGNLKISKIGFEHIKPFKIFKIASYGMLDDYIECMIRISNSIYFFVHYKDDSSKMNFKKKPELKMVYDINKEDFRYDIDDKEKELICSAIENSYECYNDSITEDDYKCYINDTKHNKFTNDLVNIICILIDKYSSSKHIEVGTLIKEVSSSDYMENYLKDKMHEYDMITSSTIIVDIKNILRNFDNSNNANLLSKYIENDCSVSFILFKEFINLLDSREFNMKRVLNLIQDIMLTISDCNNIVEDDITFFVPVNKKDAKLLMKNGLLEKTTIDFSREVEYSFNYIKELLGYNSIITGFTDIKSLKEFKDCCILKIKLPRKECVLFDIDMWIKLSRYLLLDSISTFRDLTTKDISELLLCCLNILRNDNLIVFTKDIKIENFLDKFN